MSADQPFAMPTRIAVDAKGYGWRWWPDREHSPEHFSMVPVNPDNSPIPQPVTWFVPEVDPATECPAWCPDCADPIVVSRWWAVHNLVAHPLLILWPRLGQWLHDRTEP